MIIPKESFLKLYYTFLFYYYTLYKHFNSQQREYTWGAAHQKKILKMLNSLQVIPISGGNWSVLDTMGESIDHFIR